MISCKPCSDLGGTKDVAPCAEKCNCFLTQTLMQLRTKIVEQTKSLNEFAARVDEVRCNVALTPSEEALFGVGTVKDDSMVCCILVRELRAQKRDLEAMMDRWVELVDKADRFGFITSEIRDKLADLAPRIESIFRETKALEEIELENEEVHRREIDEESRRSEERRQIFRTAVNGYEEAEARHHLERLAIREKLDALERDRLVDRGALKLALRRIMDAIGAEGTPDPSPDPRDLDISSPDQSGIRHDRPLEKHTPHQGIQQISPGVSYVRPRVRRPF